MTYEAPLTTIIQCRTKSRATDPTGRSPLVGLKARIDWEALSPELKRVREKERKRQAGAKPFEEVLMFRNWALQ
ncbi:hypothetical protein METHB2_230020 [Candidatus Methylobacter favarea]|uniref:Uncharacterized protein n=1 Tax=Candidatus Methylobacter favarea TaxID=2707345 RepID=A0A8S0X035_9GAMM|nr:hypothetical protein [Candidatus Methylobacter favarea]CAA9890498.1 hypothetical protein METHB2_230020 [Candidatus Methylobacter favarea]